MYKPFASNFVSAKSALSFGLLLICLTILGCGSPDIQFAVVHVLEEPGEQITETIAPNTYPALDNSDGEAISQVEIQFERNFQYQIIEQITEEGLDSQRVREKIVQLYKLPPNNPESSVQTALCPLSVTIPAGKKTTVTVEWVEIWAEGVINEGEEGAGDQLGTYQVFLGYYEPCSLVDQTNE